MIEQEGCECEIYREFRVQNGTRIEFITEI